MGSTNQSGLIRTKERVKALGEVFTPPHIVSAMCDMLGPEAFADITKTFLEPTCGTGNFLVEIFRRKLERCRTVWDGLTALRSIYGIDIMTDNVTESGERLYQMFAARWGDNPEARAIITNNIIWADGYIMLTLLREEETWAEAVQRYRRDFPQEPGFSVFRAIDGKQKKCGGLVPKNFMMG